MKKKGLFVAMAAVVLAFGLVLVGCDDGGGGSGSGGSSYKLSWGVWIDTPYSYVSSAFSAGGYPLTPAGSNAGYLTGSDAATAFGLMPSFTYGSGTDTGSFEDLVNTTNEGIGAPAALKAALTAAKASVPLEGIFQYTSAGRTLVAAFYIEKN